MKRAGTRRNATPVEDNINPPDAEHVSYADPETTQVLLARAIGVNLWQELVSTVWTKCRSNYSTLCPNVGTGLKKTS